MGARYDRGAEGFDARFAADPRTARRFERLEAPMRRACAGAKRLLEIGCGTARLLHTIAAPVRVGIDVSAGLLVQAARRRAPGLRLARADAHQLPFADGSFDAVVAGNAVFRYLDYPRALAECRRVLVRDGRLALHQYAARPRRLWFGAPAPVPDGNLHLESLDDLLRPAGEAGLVADRVFLWRGWRTWPYVLPVLRVSAPLRLWQHAVFVLRRR